MSLLSKWLPGHRLHQPPQRLFWEAPAPCKRNATESSDNWITYIRAAQPIWRICSYSYKFIKIPWIAGVQRASFANPYSALPRSTLDVSHVTLASTASTACHLSKLDEATYSRPPHPRWYSCTFTAVCRKHKMKDSFNLWERNEWGPGNKPNVVNSRNEIMATLQQFGTLAKYYPGPWVETTARTWHPSPIPTYLHGKGQAVLD